MFGCRKVNSLPWNCSSGSVYYWFASAARSGRSACHSSSHPDQQVFLSCPTEMCGLSWSLGRSEQPARTDEIVDRAIEVLNEAAAAGLAAYYSSSKSSS